MLRGGGGSSLDTLPSGATRDEGGLAVHLTRLPGMRVFSVFLTLSSREAAYRRALSRKEGRIYGAPTKSSRPVAYARHSGECRNPERMCADMRGVSFPLIGGNPTGRKDEKTKSLDSGFRRNDEQSNTALQGLAHAPVRTRDNHGGQDKPKGLSLLPFLSSALVWRYERIPPARLRRTYPQADARGFLPYLNTSSHSPRTFLKLRWAATQSLRPISFTLPRSIRNGRTFAGGV